MVDGQFKPGEFVLEVCKINLVNGQEIDLTQGDATVLGIKFTEDIQQTSILGQLSFADTVNIKSRGPIVGQETLDLKIKTGKNWNSEDAMIDFTKNQLMVSSIEASVNVRETVGATVINFCSQELMENYRRRLSQSFTGLYSDIVEKILKKFIKSGKNLYIEPTIGKKKIIAPNVTPFELIEMAMNEAVNDNEEPTYYFFETTMGYHFRTLESMYADKAKPMMKYIETTKPGGYVKKGGVFNWLEAISTMKGHRIMNMSDGVVNYDEGMYASKLIVHDIFNKTYNEYEYDYLNPKKIEQKMPATNRGGLGEPVYSESPINSSGDTITKHKEKTFLVPSSISKKKADTGMGYGEVNYDAHHSSTVGTGSGSFPEYNFITKNAANSVQRRVGVNRLFSSAGGGPSVEIDAHGNTLINAGDMIDLAITHRAQQEQGGGLTPDLVYGGPFLIRKIEHTFTVNPNYHGMKIWAMKDSMPKKLPSKGKPPKKGSGRVIKDYYDGF